VYRPEPSLLDPNEFVAPRNSFAMPFLDFMRHLMNVLDQLGMSVHARTDFIKYACCFFARGETNSAFLAPIFTSFLSTRISPIVFFHLGRLLLPSICR
jgi:hypothetical protein